jgi:glutamyl-tRNA synthetase
MMEKTRLAPSPTGALHLGNARTFLINWLIARQRGWKIVLRIEDLDGPRIKRGADAAAMADLRWLGIDWDEGPIYQSQRAPLYSAAIRKLLDSGHAYPCVCTRKEAALASSAPHAEDGAGVYPGTCRGRFGSVEQARAASGREPAIRFIVHDEPIEFVDAFCGAVRFESPATQLGDFVIAKADGSAAYQLAVVIDDADMGITQVVRGDDLIDSTPRQILLYRALGLAMHIPTYTHLPLVVGSDGRRLAKRHGDTRLSHYHALQIPAAHILARLADWCGISAGYSVSLHDLLSHFDIKELSHDRIVLNPDEMMLREPPPR